MNWSEIIISVSGITIPAIFTWIGIKIKNYLDDKVKESIVIKVVSFVEQTCSKLSSEEKYATALEKASDWISAKGITVSSAELDVLIESAVKNLTSEIKKGE